MMNDFLMISGLFKKTEYAECYSYPFFIVFSHSVRCKLRITKAQHDFRE